MTSLRVLLKEMLRRLGLDVRRVDRAHVDGRRQTLFARHGIDMVLDVGANVGQYASLIRASGYTGQIVSFEPDPEAFAALERRHSADPRWKGLNVALGDADGTIPFNVSADGVCSSVLNVTDAMRQSVPTSTVVRTVEVPVHRLDTIWDCHVQAGSNLHLKLDVQGLEGRVLTGAASSLDHVTLLELEVGLAPMYEGGSLIYDLLPRLYDSGFDAMWIEGGYLDPATCRYLDADVLMLRRTL